MTAPTLDDWVEQAGFAGLREQVLCHATQYLSDREAESLTRLVMISVRDEVEHARQVFGRLKDREGDEFVWFSGHRTKADTHTGRVVALEALKK